MTKENRQVNNHQDSNSTPPMGRGRGHVRGMRGTGEKAKDFKGTIKKLWRYLRSFRPVLGLIIFLAIASTVFTVISPKILGDITNVVVSSYSQNDTHYQINYQKISRLAIFLLILYVLSFLFSYTQRWLMSAVAQKITFNLRQEISEKIHRLPIRYFDKQAPGEILSRISNDVDVVSQSLEQNLTQLISAFITLVGILIMMFYLSWSMTLLALIILPLTFFSVKMIIKRSQKYFLQQQKSLGEINSHIEEMFSGHIIIKAYGQEERSVNTFQKANLDLQESAWKSQFFSGLMPPIINFISNISYVGVAILGAWLALQGKIRIGDIQAFIQYMNQFNQPIRQTADISNVFQSMAAAAERIFEFLEEADQSPESKNSIKLSNPRAEIEFDQVVFGYEQDKEVIKGFSAKIKAGQRVAIVGPTGAGKTTIVNLLMRFYDVDSGTIKIDGVDIMDMKRVDLRSLFAMVLQDTWLFKGTIKENIAYSRPQSTPEDISEIAQTLQIDHFIKTLPEACETEINEEADNISQGEKQLLTIARAMLADAPILILDEATSSVDTRTELLIQEAMDKLMKGRTSFVIAHRLSTIKKADLILVIQDGNIVEQGRHQELLKLNGFYASLYQSQFALVD